MEDIVEETIDDDQIERLKAAHLESKDQGGEVELTARFQYAYALLKSKHNQDINHGISLLENLYYEDSNARRDYLYYLAIGQTRLKNYKKALDCVEYFLKYEPQNRQAQQLRSFIKEKITKDGLVGMAITGGAALVLGGLIGLGMSLSKR